LRRGPETPKKKALKKKKTCSRSIKKKEGPFGTMGSEMNRRARSENGSAADKNGRENLTVEGGKKKNEIHSWWWGNVERKKSSNVLRTLIRHTVIKRERSNHW